MAHIHRRVFYAKVGMADSLVNHFHEADKFMRQYGANLKRRVLTDYFSGRNDRVVIEWETENAGDVEATLAKFMSQPKAREEFKRWESKLQEMIHYSEVENWTIQ